jgi:hypothetical protein
MIPTPTDDSAASPQSVSDEELAMLAEGRLQEMSEPRRSLVVRRVADDPSAAELVAQLSHAISKARSEEGDSSPEAEAAPLSFEAAQRDQALASTQTQARTQAQASGGKGSGMRRWMPMLSGVWAAAACLTIGAVIWQVLDPAPDAAAPSGGQVVQSQNNADNPEAMLEWPTAGGPQEATTRHDLRKGLLIVGVVLSVGLAVPMLWYGLRGRDKQSEG